jgi:integrase
VLTEAKTRYPYMYPLFLTLLSTGLRRSEALGLKWRDIDFSQNQLQVNRTMHHLRTGETVFRPPKTKKSRRTVALPAQCALVLRAFKEQREREREILGYRLSPDDPVFGDEIGKIYLPDTVTHVWGKLVKRLGLKGVRLHDSRHTHISHLISLGVDIKTISERVGHASVAFTLDTYGHLLANAQAKAATKFDEVLVLDRPEVLKPAAPTQEIAVPVD